MLFRSFILHFSQVDNYEDDPGDSGGKEYRGDFSVKYFLIVYATIAASNSFFR
jgi:hypothetical protein